MKHVVLRKGRYYEGTKRAISYCYNVQPGISINYANGASSIDEAYVAAHPEVLVQSSVKRDKSGYGVSTDEVPETKEERNVGLFWERCPQHLPITELLEKAIEMFE